MTPNAKKILPRIEALLGYSLSKQKRLVNQYDEIGQSASDCFCLGSAHNDHKDEVMYAYRLFPYNSKDINLSIDPATAVNMVKLVRNGVTYQTLDPDSYRLNYKNGLVKYLEQCKLWCNCQPTCDCVQLAVDADWMFEDCIPADLLLVIEEMAEFYSNKKKDIKSETLGTHRYERFDNKPPEEKINNLSILMKYAGPNGSLYQTITI